MGVGLTSILVFFISILVFYLLFYGIYYQRIIMLKRLMAYTEMVQFNIKDNSFKKQITQWYEEGKKINFLKTFYWWIEELMDKSEIDNKEEFLFYILTIIGSGLLFGISIWGLKGIWVEIPILIGVSLYLKQRQLKRINLINQQLGEFLQILKSSVDVGQGIGQALVYAEKELPYPIKKELNYLNKNIQMGKEFDRALNEFYLRNPLPEIDMFCFAISLQRQIGGSLSECLDNILHTILARQEIKAKIKALTSQARYSAYFIACLPFVILAFLTVVNPEFKHIMFYTSSGYKIMAVIIVLNTLGFIAIKKMIDSIEI